MKILSSYDRKKYYILIDTTKRRFIRMTEADLFSSVEEIVGVSKNGNLTFYPTLEDYVDKCVLRNKLAGKDYSDLKYKVDAFSVYLTNWDINSTVLEVPNFITGICCPYFVQTPALERVVFSKSVSLIGQAAFKDCVELKEVVIPESVTFIGESVFYNSGLVRAEIKTNIDYIPRNFFGFCWRLKEVILPDTIASIDEFAFGSTGLETIRLPKGLKNMHGKSFDNCEDLKDILVYDTPTSKAAVRAGVPLNKRKYIKYYK